MTITRLYLIRHGATAANLARPYRLQGRGVDLPLSEIGRAQADRTACALEAAGVEPSAVYTSPLQRAKQTAAILAKSWGLTPTPVEELSEADVGRWEGLSWDEAAAREPDLVRQFHDRPGTTPYPDGESFADVAGRALPAIFRLASLHPGATLLAVAHNVVNRSVLAEALGLPIELARGLRQSNGGINLLEIDGAGGITVVTLNAALHLEGLETAGVPPTP